MQYTPDSLLNLMKKSIEEKVESKAMSMKLGEELLEYYQDSLSGHTYLHI